MTPDKNPTLTINGKVYELDSNVPPSTTLVQYIREFAFLPGTKLLCGEGGCGICTVVAITQDSEKNGHRMFSLPSCQTLVYACVGWSIQTIEHLGNRHDGYNKLQTTLHGFYGTQCGYCTPGFVMTMHGQMQTTDNIKTDQIEKAFDGNICRCTGYRPILDAFKSLASDAPSNLTCQLKDIEEAYKSVCSKTGKACSGDCKSKDSCESKVFAPKELLSIERNGTMWHRPVTIAEVHNILNKTKNSDKIRMVVGNSGQGVFKNEGPFNIYINTTGVKDLYLIKNEPCLTIGANINLNRCIELFHASSKTKGFEHLEEVASHWENVANVGVRNIGSWGGNMMMKYAHPGFCSDIFISLVAIQAKIFISESSGKIIEVSPEEFLSKDMSKSIVVSMKIPALPETVSLTSYKITPRAVNSHAYVNAYFKFDIDASNKVLSRPIIAIGGINSKFVRASKTEYMLEKIQLNNLADVKKAVRTLGEELTPEENYVDSSPEYRRSLAQSLLYKTILKVLGKSVNGNLQSGGLKLQRPISSSKQKYDSNEELWPVGKGIPKLESQPQISGEAEYLDDIPCLPTEVFGAFVQSTIASGEIGSIDVSACMKVQGVLDVIKADDIPGKNTFFDAMGLPDPVFAEGTVKYYGQSIALVVAKSKKIANEAKKLVRITYKNVNKPVITIKDAMENKRMLEAPDFVTQSSEPFVVGDINEGLKHSKNIVEGEVEFGSQFHFTMEPMAARAVPMENGFDIYGTTQWPTLTQSVIASNLNIPAHTINMSVRRIGGGYGGKISRANIVCSAAAIAANKLKVPVRIALDLSTHMTLVGWREPYLVKYKVGFNNDGIFNAISMDVIADVGHAPNECSSPGCGSNIPNTYYCPNWKIQPYMALTNNAANTWCRTPGHVEAVASIENIIERVAAELKVDPLKIREVNFFDEKKPQTFGPRRETNLVRSTIFPLLKLEAEVASRKEKIAGFNQTNRWRKRGLSMIPLRYLFDMIPLYQYNVQVVIYESDGTIAISHGGIEMGQGINTKVAQVAAKILQVPMELIQIKPTDLFVGANSFVTGGSYGSDINAHGIKIACEKLRARIDEASKTFVSDNGPPSWQKLIKHCFENQVDLCERYFTFSKEHPNGYDIWAAACLEVEIDVLTGQFLILRADIIEDCGRSLSPYVDMGQVEGAFIMGLGLFTLEKLKLDPKTGEKLSNGTWEYKPPTALDIPVDFRVSFLPKGDNPNAGVLRSKTTGEPALCLSYCVISALREAISSARKDSGLTDWYEIDTPLTVEKIQQLCATNCDKLIF